jgi:hypothetical protein
MLRPGGVPGLPPLELIGALWMMGQRGGSRDFFIDAINLRKWLWSVVEDGHPRIGALADNLPPTYWMIGVDLDRDLGCRGAGRITFGAARHSVE